MRRSLYSLAVFATTLVHPTLAEPLSMRGIEVAPDNNAPEVEGHPLTSVVVTQCNLIVAVYMTMPDGRLLRFDRQAEIPVDTLVSMAYTAGRSERVEVSCNGLGASGFEPHEPT